MAVLKKGNWNAPFFGNSSNYSTGRDSLGLQTTSQASYSTLLPGLTNLTNRIRYYGFYCWLLEVYAHEVRDTNLKVQNRFIRRGEYMIALLMQLFEKEATQIPGSLFATEEVKNKANKLSYDLKFGADIEKGKNTYWKYSSGAFGQYYAGALQAIGLIVHRDDSPVFVCTKHDDESIVTGTKLANVFGLNISEETKRIFINNIEQGVLLKTDAETLYNEFSITSIPRNTEEWELYTRMLISNDQPLFQNVDNQTFFRRDSMYSVLSYIKDIDDSKEWDFFTCELYNRKGVDFKDQETKSSYGWYYYQLNEYWHFGVETLFWSVLETLSSKYFQVNLVEFLNEFQETMLNALLKFGLATNGNQKLKDVMVNIEDSDAWGISQDIRENIKSNDVPKSIYLGFKMLFIIFNQSNDEFNKLRSFATYNGMERDGDCISGLKEFKIAEEITIEVFLQKFLLKNIINRHLEVAYRKMGSGTKNTLKFGYEDNFLKHVETMEPVWTTPRIYAMYQFFKDLGYVNNEGEITEVGNQLIAN